MFTPRSWVECGIKRSGQLSAVGPQTGESAGMRALGRGLSCSGSAACARLSIGGASPNRWPGIMSHPPGARGYLCTEWKHPRINLRTPDPKTL